jgi:hypothetical protein
MKYALALAAVVGLIFFGATARADEPKEPRPDDRVIFNLSAEDWVTTKTAHVEVNVDAAVSGAGAATARGDMLKAVGDLAKADWRLTSFTRSQDQTGLERWSAIFEARLPESELGGLGDAARKVSKAGMQVSIGNIDFTPTLDEMETARSGLRAQIYKLASEQLTALNGSLPGRNYRIALVDFTSDDEEEPPMPQVFHGPIRAMAMANGAAPQPEAPSAAPIERAEKITLTAHVVLATTPERGAEHPPMPPPAPAK